MNLDLFDRLESLRRRWPDFEWLVRTDEEQGFFVHVHAGPVYGNKFKVSYPLFGPDPLQLVMEIEQLIEKTLTHQSKS